MRVDAMTTGRRLRAPAVVALVVALAACGGAATSGHSAPTSTQPVTTLSVPTTPQATVAGFVRAWQARQWSTMIGYVASPPDGFVSELDSTYRDIDASGLTVTASAPTVTGTTGYAAVTQQMQIAGRGPLTLHTTIDLTQVGGHWMVAWSWSSLQSQLGTGYKLTLVPTWSPRAAITGLNGRALVTTTTVVQVGLAGERIKQPARIQQLLVAGGATAAQAAAAIKQAQAAPTQFVPVFDVSMQDYTTKIRPSELYRIPGTQFEPATDTVAATPGLGTYLTGGIGPVTAAELASLGSDYQVGDQVGQGGLEGQYEKQLAGTPGASLEVVDGDGGLVGIVARWPGTAGTPVRTSISLAMQEAAESAIASTTVPSALVAVQASTGRLLAIATHDPTGSGVDYALDATEAPGSTFKIITSTALIDQHLTLTSPATCPALRTVDGESFHNDEGEASGQIDLLTAFAQSCNTAFIGLATSRLDSAELLAAAARYRLGQAVQMGYPAFGGSVPTPTDEADLAAASIGQGQTVVSPLDLAMVAAAVDSGQVRAPRLVTGAPDDTVAPVALGPKVLADLRTMMAAVVTSGTAAGSGLPAGTSGKTGTAEFGTANPPLTHGWFIGFRGDVAFAVFVNVGVSGAAVAAPLAARFLEATASVHLP